MVLPVNSSSNVLFGFSAVAAIGLATALYYHSRENAEAQPTAPSLAQKDVSILRRIPLISSAVNYLFPAKLPVIVIEKSYSVVELANKLLAEFFIEEHRALDTLIINGDNLEIIEDPGILALNPMKVILVGAQIVPTNQANSLCQRMKEKGWYADAYGLKVIEVASEKEAIKAAPMINFSTSELQPTVYSVRR